MNPDSDQLRWDMATFRRLAKVAADRPDLCERIPFIDVYQTRVLKETIPWHRITGDVSASLSSPWFLRSPRSDRSQVNIG